MGCRNRSYCRHVDRRCCPPSAVRLSLIPLSSPVTRQEEFTFSRWNGHAGGDFVWPRSILDVFALAGRRRHGRIVQIAFLGTYKGDSARITGYSYKALIHSFGCRLVNSDTE